MDLRNTVYWEIWMRAWNFHKQNSDVRQDDEYWECLCNKSKSLLSLYEGKQGYKLMKGLLLGIIDELEDIANKE